MPSNQTLFTGHPEMNMAPRRKVTIPEAMSQPKLECGSSWKLDAMRMTPEVASATPRKSVSNKAESAGLAKVITPAIV